MKHAKLIEGIEEEVIEGLQEDLERPRRKFPIKEVMSRTIEAVLKHIEHSKEPVTIRGFGKFEWVYRRSRVHWDLREGKMREVPPQEVLVFRPAPKKRRKVTMQ